MNKQAFVSLLKNPEKITSSDIEGLEEVLQNFPYFQAAQILTAKGFKEQGKMLAGQKVRKAAVYSADRKELKKLLNTSPAKTEVKAEVIEIKIQEETVKPFLPPIAIEPILEFKTETPLVIQEVVFPIENILAKTASKTKEVIPEVAANKEKETSKYISETTRNQFFEELQRNLESLRQMKASIAENDFTKTKTKEDHSLKPSQIENKKEEKFTPEKLIGSLYEIPTSHTTITVVEEDETIKLIPPTIKEHNQEETLFSSRLDEVVSPSKTTSDSNRIKALDESELLLNYLSYLNESSQKPVVVKKKTDDIINKFIKENPVISQLKKNSLPETQEDKAVESYKPKTTIVSENMAKIMLLQGKKDKAVEIYEQLILKNPEKKAYFTSQIEKINQQ